MTDTKNLTIVSKNKIADGWVKKFNHSSDVLDCQMTFSIFLPPQAENQKVPVLYWLSGLTCTDDNFMQKAGAQRVASELGLAIVAPDTSPRGEGVADDPNGIYDLGLGAGFYVNATEAPWSEHYKMYDYVTKELPGLIQKNFSINNEKASISGHSMGGHGALICSLKNPGLYRSVSAFSPIVAPSQCPWGEKAFSHYLGKDKSSWKQYDSCELIKQATEQLPILIDQGDADDFLNEQLKPERLEQACKETNYPLTLRMQKGYDHSYYFISTFIEDHLRYHSKWLS